MIWKAKYTRADYANGTTRLKRVFAFKPTYINGSIVWLTMYEVLQVYEHREVKASLNNDNPNEATVFRVCSWVDASKRLIT